MDVVSTFNVVASVMGKVIPAAPLMAPEELKIGVMVGVQPEKLDNCLPKRSNFVEADGKANATPARTARSLDIDRVVVMASSRVETREMMSVSV